MTPVARGGALAASGTAIGIVIALAAIVTANRADEPVAYLVPSAVAFFGPMVASSAIAVLAAIKGSRLLLIVAATALAIASASAFSGVTLVLLVPAVLLVYVAARRDRPGRPGPRSVRRWLLVIVAAVATAPVVVLLLIRIGVVGLVIGLLIAAAVGPAAAGRTGPRPDTRSMVVSIAVVALLVAGALMLYGRTEELCWERVQTPTGPVESVGPGSPSGQMVLTGPGEGGCGPVPTIDGLALGLLLLGLSIAAAALAPGAPPAPDGPPRRSAVASPVHGEDGPL